MRLPLLLLLLDACAPRVSPVRRAVPVPEPGASLPSPGPAAPPQALAPAPEHQHHRLVQGPGIRHAPAELWRRPLAGPITSPLTADETGLWAVAGGGVSRVEWDGSVIWTAAVDAVGSVSLTPDGPVVGSRDGTLLALSRTSGLVSLAWGGGARPRGSAVPLGTGLAWLSSDGALRLTGGAVLQVALTASEGLSSDGETAYFSTQDGEFWAVGTQGPRWKAPLDGPGVGDPIVDGERIFVAWEAQQDRPGGVQALGAPQGQRIWSMATRASPSGGMALGGTLLVPLVDGSLLGLSPDTGEILWETRLGTAPITTAPLTDGRSAWIGDSDGRLHRVDLDDGGVAWSFSLGAPVTGDPVLLGPVLILGLADGTLVALQEAP